MEKPKLTKEYILDWLLGYAARHGDFVTDYVVVNLKAEYDENVYHFLLGLPKTELLDLIKDIDEFDPSSFVLDLLEKSDNQTLVKLLLFLESGKNMDVMLVYSMRYGEDLNSITNNTFLEHAQHLDLSELKKLLTKLINSESNKNKHYTDDKLLREMEKVGKMRKYNRP